MVRRSLGLSFEKCTSQKTSLKRQARRARHNISQNFSSAITTKFSNLNKGKSCGCKAQETTTQPVRNINKEKESRNWPFQQIAGLTALVIENPFNSYCRLGVSSLPAIKHASFILKKSTESNFQVKDSFYSCDDHSQ